MEESHKFFANKACMYYPCHDTPEEDFNCLFCYCPLYALGEKCGGNFSWAVYKDIKIKICSNCPLPHEAKNYQYVMDLLCEENISWMFRESGQ